MYKLIKGHGIYFWSMGLIALLEMVLLFIGKYNPNISDLTITLQIFLLVPTVLMIDNIVNLYLDEERAAALKSLDEMVLRLNKNVDDSNDIDILKLQLNEKEKEYAYWQLKADILEDEIKAQENAIKLSQQQIEAREKVVDSLIEVLHEHESSKELEELEKSYFKQGGDLLTKEILKQLNEFIDNDTENKNVL